ncbi:DNA gyrase inhibitor YacG [Pasteurellaceae bacterium USgator11]|nr:DNA gyrase inhibitor YacG [Pasteurellaceae bacterium UScroc12]TNG98543.1 DNA gyrase inhibitor YacG [Pasteurellaceae bacterium USgator41]TNH00247.1 DNA gyrase inhibitor YacG [Pasteurellaceae bacterium UScroc31]TNH01469.1 DNA gyrase inhibitor YacG [Pasteurellaceae bacterium USgator11]
MKNEMISVACPICRKSVEWSENSPFRPFCSKRCQLIDLGEWANEEKTIASDTADFALDSSVNPEAQDWVKH